MGFITSATTLTLTAKLTAIGRQRLISTNNSLITTFSLGDSDANYNAELPLNSGEVPTIGGDVSSLFSPTNSVGLNTPIKSTLFVNGTGITKKAVEPQSIKILTDTVRIGSIDLSYVALSQNIVDRNNITGDSLVNLFYSFGLPLNSTDDTKFTGTTYANGGYSDTALSGFGTSKILVIGIENAVIGELMDGKAVKTTITNTAATYTIYSTFQNKGLTTSVEDAKLIDSSVVASGISNNIAFLFSDSIQKPNSASTLSWATGFNSVKPFSNNSKQFFNLLTDINTSKIADKAVGIAYLDKGFIVITNPTIVNNFDSSGSTLTATTVTVDSVSTSVIQNITCVANRGEFGSSSNSTFTPSDKPRISELGLYDTNNNLIAIAKFDRHLLRNVNEFTAFSVNISL